ncbi:hypothetical protein EN871_22700 [bacterium M00.F.Ca.ET.228.01.1.1]|nr:hypothetical protein EN871_22700 [bacterium M00.F.Ca.ET.228.01.1.1]TGR98579.1 hypothetical protein EN834_22315 [bacterium M00.F.Ca.ET.191.01.1.1]TGU02914.1 hypothetical protein EN798_23135 [bacterium M00.F.Ca.ET.155.01.1.1]
MTFETAWRTFATLAGRTASCALTAACAVLKASRRAFAARMTFEMAWRAFATLASRPTSCTLAAAGAVVKASRSAFASGAIFKTSRRAFATLAGRATSGTLAAAGAVLESSRRATHAFAPCGPVRGRPPCTIAATLTPESAFLSPPASSPRGAAGGALAARHRARLFAAHPSGAGRRRFGFRWTCRLARGQAAATDRGAFGRSRSRMLGC